MKYAWLLLALGLVAGCGGTSAAPTTPTAYPTSTVVPTPTVIAASRLTAVITGRVTDARTGKGIAGATISLGNRKNGVRTNSAGHYRLPIPSGRSTSVFVSARGYSGSLAVGKVAAHSVTRVDFKLNRSIRGKPNIPPFPGTFGKP